MPTAIVTAVAVAGCPTTANKCRNRDLNKTLAVMAPPQPRRSPASTGSVKHAMTMTENILARASERSSLEPGDNVWVNVDVLMTHDVCGPGTIGIFKREFGQNRQGLSRLQMCLPHCSCPRRALQTWRGFAWHRFTHPQCWSI